MSAIQEARARHLLQAAQDFDEGIEDVRKLLLSPDPAVARLSAQVFGAHLDVLCDFFGKFVEQSRAHQTLLEDRFLECPLPLWCDFVRSFLVSYMHSGSAGVGHWSYQDRKRALCSKDDPEAHPFICAPSEDYRTFDPRARCASLEEASAAFEVVEAEHYASIERFFAFETGDTVEEQEYAQANREERLQITPDHRRRMDIMAEILGSRS